jgi:hypothetical protein
MKHTIQTIQLAQVTGRTITIEGLTGTVVGVVRKEKYKTSKPAVTYYQLTMHIPLPTDECNDGTCRVETFDYNPPKSKLEVPKTNEYQSFRVENNNGLHLHDLMNLVAQHGLVGDDPFLTLCVAGIETNTLRITEAALDVNTPEEGPGGIMWLRLDDSESFMRKDKRTARQFVQDAFGTD